jgi:RHS repeat-associated protein
MCCIILSNLVSAADYYPFGMMMPGRTYSAQTGYRYGFNGKENDNEVKGDGNQQDYGMRVYDPRVGRILSVDPIAKSFPWYSPYQFSGNSPISNLDLDGLEPLKATIKQINYVPHDNHVIITTSLEIKVQVINMSSKPNDKLDLSGIGDVVKNRFITQFFGTHTAELPSAFKLNQKTENPEQVPLYNQKYTYNVSSAIARVQTVESSEKLANDAIIVAVVDNIAPITWDNEKIDPIGLTSQIEGIVMLEADQVTIGKTNFEKGQNLVLHEMGHSFQEQHSPDTDDVMHKSNSKNLQFSETQVVRMLRTAIKPWEKLWKGKKKGQDLNIDKQREGNTNEKVDKFKREHE